MNDIITFDFSHQNSFGIRIRQPIFTFTRASLGKNLTNALIRLPQHFGGAESDRAVLLRKTHWVSQTSAMFINLWEQLA
ncbi:MAG: hypothetical protein K8F25_19245 [Fimbriimonadaceae bacterium]|nr:hypothetical protein [Alphaproteobacteria bacterium]